MELLLLQEVFKRIFLLKRMDNNIPNQQFVKDERSKPVHSCFDLLSFWQRSSSRADNFGLGLLLLLFFDALANPYAGIVHDARLYTVQALSHLHPQWYAKDLFFLHGSQDSFSFFSTIHAQFVSFFGIEYGTFLLFFYSRVFFYGSLLQFFRKFLKDNFLALLVTVLFAAGQVQYIFFDVNEPFLTPRLLAEAFSLLALAAALGSSPVHCLCWLVAAGLIHPLMVIGPGLVIVCHWFNQKKWQWLAAVFGCAAFGLGILFFINDGAGGGISLLQPFGDKWREIVFERSSYLLPHNWSRGSWLAVAGTFLVSICSIISIAGEQRRLAVIVAGVAGVLLGAGVIATYMSPLALPVQLQLWRGYWLLRVLSPALAVLWVIGLWQQGGVLKRAAALIVCGAMILGGGITEITLPWLVLAVVLAFMPFTMGRDMDAEQRNKILALVGVALMLAPLFGAGWRLLNYFEQGSLHFMVVNSAALLNPIFRVLCLVVLLVVLVRVRSTIVVLFALVLVGCLIIPTLSQDFRYPPAFAESRKVVQLEPTSPEILAWQKIISQGSLVLTDGSVSVETIWFDFHAGSYYSQMQGAGILFNRNLAVEYGRRPQEIEIFSQGVFSGKERIWCEENGIDFVISRMRLPLLRLSEYNGIILYSIFQK